MLEYLIVALLVFTVINTGFLYKTSADLRELLDANRKWGRPSQADTDLENGDVDAVIERSLKDIADKPRHAKARWYLGKAYYEKEMWKEANEQMQIVAQLQPCWQNESTDSYIHEITRRMRSDSDNQA